MQTFVSERWWSLTWVSCSTVWPSQERWHWSEPDAPPLRHCPCSNNPPCSPGLQNKKKTTTQRCNHCLNWKSAKLSHRKRKDINMTFHSLLFCLKSIITLIVYNIYTHVYIREYVNVTTMTNGGTHTACVLFFLFTDVCDFDVLRTNDTSSFLSIYSYVSFWWDKLAPFMALTQL